jgi:hypothetical protein
MARLAAVPDLERELDELYGLPLEEFTRARNDLAGRLKRSHQADAAATVQALKKPTAVAWAANRLARDEPKAVAALIDAGSELRRVQERALGGRATASDVADAAAAERDAVRMLVSAAKRELGSRANASFLDRLDQTLRTAATDPAEQSLLRRGRLTQELRPVGFGGLEAVRLKPRRSDEVTRAARQRVAELRAATRAATREAQAAERTAAEAERSANVLRAEADEKRREADAAATRLAAAEDDLKRR